MRLDSFLFAYIVDCVVFFVVCDNSVDDETPYLYDNEVYLRCEKHVRNNEVQTHSNESMNIPRVSL